MVIFQHDRDIGLNSQLFNKNSCPKSKTLNKDWLTFVLRQSRQGFIKINGAPRRDNHPDLNENCTIPS